MARPTPSMCVLSKNTVSPIAIAATIESARSPRALVDAAANTPTPTVAATQPSRSAPRRGPPPGVGCPAGAVPVQRPRAQAHGARRVARPALQPVAEGLRGQGRVRAAGAGAAEAHHVHRRQ